MTNTGAGEHTTPGDKDVDHAGQQIDNADHRTELAVDRTVLAAERTYAAWVRTGLAALASGMTARALLQNVAPGWLVRITASVLILFSAFCFAAAVWREDIHLAPPGPVTRRLPARLLVGVNALLIVVTLAALVGIWLR